MAQETLALVTGASRGIGAAIARALLDEGYAVAGTYRTHAVPKALANHPRFFAIAMDVSKRRAVQNGIAAARRHFKNEIAILVNNAALADERPFETITDAQWDRVLQTNLRGPFSLAQETLPAMVTDGWGRIVNIVSIGGQWGGMRQVHYAASKAGLINFTQSLARLYSGKGITANAVSPGLVATEMVAKEMKSKGGKAKATSIPVGRIATPQEIAAAVRFLCSRDAAYITGQTLNVNGGLYFQ